ncbi:MAG: transposase [Thermoplasmata archaeon]
MLKDPCLNTQTNFLRKFIHGTIVLLAIKIYFNVSYRELIAEVEYNPTIIDQLSLEYIPHYTTVQKFMERMKVRGLEKVFRKALLIIRERFENDMLGIDATGYSTEYHSHYYDKRVKEFGLKKKRRFMKSTIIVSLSNQMILSYKIALNFRNDSIDFPIVLKKVPKSIIREFTHIIGDKGYDSEKNHQIARSYA